MRITRRDLKGLYAEELQAAIRGLVWALADIEGSNEDRTLVERTLWLLESELLNRGLLPDKHT